MEQVKLFSNLSRLLNALIGVYVRRRLFILASIFSWYSHYTLYIVLLECEILDCKSTDLWSITDVTATEIKLPVGNEFASKQTINRTYSFKLA